MKDNTIVQEHLRAKDFPDDAVQNVTKKLLRHPDILKECAGSIEQRGFPADGISVFGYTAEHLMVTLCSCTVFLPIFGRTMRKP